MAMLWNVVKVMYRSLLLVSKDTTFQVTRSDTYLKDPLGLLQQNECLLIALSLDVVVGSVNQLIENDRNLLLIHLYLLVVVFVEGVTFLREIAACIARLSAASADNIAFA